MSLIVAIKNNDGVYFGCDSIRSRGDKITEITGEDSFKVVKIGDYYIGGVGTVACIQLFHSVVRSIKVGFSKLTKKAIVTRVIPVFYRALKAEGKLSSDSRSFDADFLITDGKRVFLIKGNFDVVQVPNNRCIGCTEVLARAVVNSAPWFEEPEDTILRAMRMSSRMNKGVGAPYYLFNTTSGEMKKEER